MLETLYKVVTIFDEEEIDYCLIGGLAMMLHHGRANTVDIDFYILVEEITQTEEPFLKRGYDIKTAGEFQRQVFIDGIQIDLLLADYYIGNDVVKRAVPRQLENHIVRIATPEDLIILKTLADRSIDRRDIEELRELFADRLDERYITKKLRQIKRRLEN